MSVRENGSRIPEELPVAIIGGGPIGLAAAAHLSSRGQPFVLLEAGHSVGAHVSAWGHVQVFSPWRYNVDPVAGSMLKAAGWKEPDPDVLPTGGELVAEYLRPLGALPQIAPHLRLGTRVLAVARAGHDKMKTAGRDEAPFEVRVRSSAGEDTLLARAVIDASGTYARAEPAGRQRPRRDRRDRVPGARLLRHPRRRWRPPRPLRGAGRPGRGQRALRLQHAPRPGRPRRGRAGQPGSPGRCAGATSARCTAAARPTRSRPAGAWAPGSARSSMRDGCDS